MKYLLIIIFLIGSVNSLYSKEKCEGVLAKLKSECNILGKSMNKMKEFSDKNDLITSLKKLYKENLTLIKTSPIYSQVYNSHPTVFERINNLES